jgi:hypothetical protein
MKNLIKFSVLTAIFVSAVLTGWHVYARSVNPAVGDSSSLSAAGALLSANNLSDVANATTSRNSLFQNMGFTEIGSSTAVGASSTPTHALTFAVNASSGVAFYNTNDQSTNFERATLQWSGNVFLLKTGIGGSGTIRNLSIGTTNRTFTIVDGASSSGFYQLNSGSGTAGAVGLNVAGTWNASSGVNPVSAISPTISETGSAGYTAFLINPTETSNGSGANQLFRATTATGTVPFVILSSGNVGIGTSTPAALLHVWATASSTQYIGDSTHTSCLVMGDSDSVGVTYVTANNGVLSATTTKPLYCM